MAGRIRGFETVGDMVRSMGIVMIVVVGILLITFRQTPDPVQTDPAPVLAGVAQAAPFEAEIPPPTPEGWRVTSARVTLPDADPYSWYVGYFTPEEEFVAVSQVYGSPETYLEEIGAEGRDAGTVEIDGDVWARVEQSDGTRRSLIRSTPRDADEAAVTTVVTGTAPWSVLEDVAAGLRPASAATEVPATPAATPSA
jgi:hypothetical protein